MAGILHYFFTAAFAWLFCETLLISLFDWVAKRWAAFILFFLIGWGKLHKLMHTNITSHRLENQNTLFRSMHQYHHRMVWFSYVITVNREYFIVKIFSDSLAFAKIKRTEMHTQY